MNDHPVEESRRPGETGANGPPAGLSGRCYGWLLARLYNVQRVDAGVYRSAQIYGRHLGRLIAYLRLRTIMNLRGPNPDRHWYTNEKRVCRELGVRLISVPLSSRRLPERSMLLELWGSLEQAERPLLLKCSGGADRSSLLAGIYVMQQAFTAVADRKEVVAVAKRQTRRLPYFHFPRKEQRWIRIFFDFYGDDHGGLSPIDWIRERYSKERFADYMRDRGLVGYWKG